MKTCHICEHIVKSTRALSCLTCKRAFCYPCISQFFPDTSSQYIPTTINEALKQPRTKQCYYCLKLCKCHKCTTNEAIVMTLNVPGAKEQQEKTFVLGDEETNQISPLFQGKKLSELPDYLQRIYAKKKVIYTKHQLSVLKNQNMHPQAPQDQHEQSENKEVRKDKEKMQNAEQVDQDRAPQIEEGNSEDGKMQVQNENEYADEENSEEAQHSRNASEESVSNQVEAENIENEGNSSQQQMVDQDEESGQREHQSNQEVNPEAMPVSNIVQNQNVSILDQSERPIGTSNIEGGQRQALDEKKNI